MLTGPGSSEGGQLDGLQAINVQQFGPDQRESFADSTPKRGRLVLPRCCGTAGTHSGARGVSGEEGSARIRCVIARLGVPPKRERGSHYARTMIFFVKLIFYIFHP